MANFRRPVHADVFKLAMKEIPFQATTDRAGSCALLQFFNRERRRKDAKGRLGLLIHFEPRKNTEYTEVFGLLIHQSLFKIHHS